MTTQRCGLFSKFFDDLPICCSELDGVRDSVPDSPIADALLALKHAVVHAPHSGSNWMSPSTAQLSYSSHCPSPTLASSYQPPVLSASPIYDRSALARSHTQSPFPFASSHHHHPQHHPQQQQHRYDGTDSQDSSSPALTSTSSMYPVSGVHRPVYRRDGRDFTFGSAFAHDAPGAARLLRFFLICSPVKSRIYDKREHKKERN